MTSSDVHSCPRCSLRFPTTSELDYHLRHDHAKVAPAHETPRTTLAKGLVTVCVDPERDPPAALAIAAALASQAALPAEVIALARPGVAPAVVEAYLRARSRDLMAAGAPASTWHRLRGNDPVAAILDHVASGATTLVCMDTHSRTALAEIALGSVSEGVLRGSTAPVLLVGPRVPRTEMACKRIVAGIDGSELASRAAFVAADLATRLSAELLLVEVLSAPVPAGGDVLETADLHRLAAALPVPASYDALHGPNPAKAILDAIEGEDGTIVALGTHGRTGLHRLTAGSVALDIVRHAPCPVLVVPQPAASA